MRKEKSDKNFKKKKVLASQVSIMEDEFLNEASSMDSDLLKRSEFAEDKDTELFHMIERKK